MVRKVQVDNCGLPLHTIIKSVSVNQSEEKQLLIKADVSTQLLEESYFIICVIREITISIYNIIFNTLYN